MKIAIHAADLDHERIDGTRVYLFNMLKKFGEIDKDDSFLIYHQNNFNKHLTPPTLKNYLIKKITFPWLWTQTCFAWRIFWDKPNVLWMPVHNLPLLHRKSLKIVVTVHDLAFKIFPEYFTKKDLLKLNKLSDMAISKADHLIAVSEATKNDILKFYPQISAEKITVIYHGFDPNVFQLEISQKESEEILKAISPAGELKPKTHILYVGAIQPRKNLGVLIEAFEEIKGYTKMRSSGSVSSGINKDLKLIFAGAPAWKAEETLKKISISKFSKDIIVTGTIGPKEISALFQNAKMFVFPSLYEGFGIPVLEAMASGVPTILAKNSSLTEVGGDAALYFKTGDSADLAKCMEKIMEDENLQKELVQKGNEHVKNFSWEKCARATLDILTKK